MRQIVAIGGVALLFGCSPARVAAVSSGNAVVAPASSRATARESNDPAPAAAPASENAPLVAAAPAASSGAASVATSPRSAPRVEFATQIRPILETRCMPCHFEGGKMYDRLPFDRPQTIRTLGTRLFTRIKDPKEQELISAFLSESPRSCADGAQGKPSGTGS